MIMSTNKHIIFSISKNFMNRIKRRKTIRHHKSASEIWFDVKLPLCNLDRNDEECNKMLLKR